MYTSMLSTAQFDEMAKIPVLDVCHCPRLTKRVCRVKKQNGVLGISSTSMRDAVIASISLKDDDPSLRLCDRTDEELGLLLKEYKGRPLFMRKVMDTSAFLVPGKSLRQRFKYQQWPEKYQFTLTGIGHRKFGCPISTLFSDQQLYCAERLRAVKHLIMFCQLKMGFIIGDNGLKYRMGLIDVARIPGLKKLLAEFGKPAQWWVKVWVPRWPPALVKFAKGKSYEEKISNIQAIVLEFFADDKK